MFPTNKNYIAGAYLRGGQPYYLADPKVVAELEKTAQKIIKLLRRGVKVTPTQPDAIRIEYIMLTEMHQELSESQSIQQRFIKAHITSSKMCQQKSLLEKERSDLER